MFQSPSRRGWSCIAERSACNSRGRVISVPFSSGMVLHLRVSLDMRTATCMISVPFSSGMVLHLAGRMTTHDHFRCFSPLLVGDGLASGMFGHVHGRITHISVPFSSGMVLHLPSTWRSQSPSRRGWSCMRLPSFQSPSRRGWSCISADRCRANGITSNFSPLLVGDGLASRGSTRQPNGDCIISVPFSSGMVLHPRRQSTDAPGALRCFSPLLVGDGLASVQATVRSPDLTDFSPLLVGDGLASQHRRIAAAAPDFSPLLVGDGLASRAWPLMNDTSHFSPLLVGDGLASLASRISVDQQPALYFSISVPFSSGMVLHLQIVATLTSFRFSPLLDGDGLASCECHTRH